MNQLAYHVRRGDKRFGPFTGEQLKQLAASGKLRRDDIVVEGEKRLRAELVKGLFQDTTEEVGKCIHPKDLTPPVPPPLPPLAIQSSERSNPVREEPPRDGTSCDVAGGPPKFQFEGTSRTSPDRTQLFQLMNLLDVPQTQHDEIFDACNSMTIPHIIRLLAAPWDKGASFALAAFFLSAWNFFVWEPMLSVPLFVGGLFLLVACLLPRSRRLLVFASAILAALLLLTSAMLILTSGGTLGGLVSRGVPAILFAIVATIFIQAYTMPLFALRHVYRKPSRGFRLLESAFRKFRKSLPRSHMDNRMIQFQAFRRVYTVWYARLHPGIGLFINNQFGALLLLKPTDAQIHPKKKSLFSGSHRMRLTLGRQTLNVSMKQAPYEHLLRWKDAKVAGGSNEGMNPFRVQDAVHSNKPRAK